MAAGWGHTAALLEDGTLHTWGWPANGRLGHSFAACAADEEEARLVERCVWAPRLVEQLAGVRLSRIACGFDSMYALAGVSGGQPQLKLCQCAQASLHAAACACLLPTVSSPLHPFSPCAADGTLFSFGANDLGQLGRPSQQGGEAFTPRQGAWVVHVEAERRASAKFRNVSGARPELRAQRRRKKKAAGAAACSCPHFNFRTLAPSPAI